MNHPFYVKGQGFVAACKLSKSDEIMNASGGSYPVEYVELEEKQEIVYNFQVEDYHTYYVGENSVLVHNDCPEGEAPTKGGSDSGELKEVNNSIKGSSKYPKDFKARTNGTTSNKINNQQLLEKLREIESGTWKKIYKDGYDAYGNKISIHYFQSQSGKVFDVKVKFGWSN